MKRFFAFILLCLSVAVQAAPWDLTMSQYDQFGTGLIPRLLPLPASSAPGLVAYDPGTNRPVLWAPDSSITISGGSIGVSTATLNSKFNQPAGTTGQYVRGDGSLATFPSLPAAFDFGYPSARSLSVSTSYQATDPSKAAIVTVSPQCVNSTTVIAASACTMQVRVHNTTASCASGTVIATWTSTYALGLLLTNTSGSPIDIKLPAGAHFILCPTAGTFTINAAVDQSAG